MDEAEKYQQRLQAIAEKRRLQEEQDRARREMEDEKLRLQQLKRKSLRDQWLMEGPPLSPTSSDAQSPRSPLWGSQAQEIEKHIDKLQTESQRLAEEEKKLKEQMEDGQTEAENVAEAAAEVVQSGVVENGEEKTSGSETTEDVVKENSSLQQDEMATVLTNGGGEVETEDSHSALEENVPSSTNGPVGSPDDTITMTFPGCSEAEPDQVPDVKINEEEEGTLVMRAERVIITDDGDDIPEDTSPQEEQQEAGESESSPQPKPQVPEEAGEAADEVVKAEVAPDTSSEPKGGEERSETISPTAEAETAAGDTDNTEGDVKATENEDRETKTEGEEEEEKLEAPTSVQVQSPADALEGTTVASVPVYSEAQPSSLAPNAEDEAAAAPEGGAPEGAEAALITQDPATLPGQFQEVSLADPQENQRTEAGPREQEPLLSQAKPPQTQAEPAAVSSPASTETYTPTRANQGGETAAPKHKSCQCCSVM
ncbi:paralemmin-3 [Myripristis murdjan]|uniref:Paralemmin-1-like n=1 Tax=Myripristis murdjan TaxID=586833 RepID=A0A668AL41_9TELE|nr:paralemmin-1-like [Myripristis murdjan]XP_029914756.1 paralemmin-1-like [Myripristis murdjan]XP_029914764.1 paralemmin-1-like [Myripristis murdjan]